MTGRWRDAVFSRVLGIQPLGQDKIDLQRAALPLAADGIREFEIELRSVERAISWIERVIDPRLFDGIPERTLRLVPGLIRAGADLGAVGEPSSELPRTQNHDKCRSTSRKIAWFPR